MRQKAFRQNQTGLAPPLKSLSPAAGTGGHEYELYHVNQLHIVSSFARWVCDLPGEFCCFLRPDIRPGNFFNLFGKRRHLAGSERASCRHFGGKGENHRNPPQKGGEKMETIPRNDFSRQHRFDAFCKEVLRNEAKDYLRELGRQRDREKSLDALTQQELDKLSIVDHYPSDSYVFSSHGYDLLINNELVAEAFASLPEQEQSILILHCVLEMADGEIGSLMGMSRSAVQRHRTSTLKQLRVKLMALMPGGR